MRTIGHESHNNVYFSTTECLFEGNRSAQNVQTDAKMSALDECECECESTPTIADSLANACAVRVVVVVVVLFVAPREPQPKHQLARRDDWPSRRLRDHVPQRLRLGRALQVVQNDCARRARSEKPSTTTTSTRKASIAPDSLDSSLDRHCSAPASPTRARRARTR